MSELLDATSFTDMQLGYSSNKHVVLQLYMSVIDSAIALAAILEVLASNPALQIHANIDLLSHWCN